MVDVLTVAKRLRHTSIIEFEDSDGSTGVFAEYYSCDEVVAQSDELALLVHEEVYACARMLDDASQHVVT
ncbi:small CPxCG-related zinc finger protein [Haloferax denitrificans ATCC 35960]|uniref:Small CPxCG-related zinc finger protein n=1 Tax=Haloferax denitrificans ATCC 35960 TaxID=662478 RepID=M0JJS2_9EURY|nr:small CPxCG-related zinc finger protein [Haloferax denitrificans ATCC 35960]